MQNEGIINPYFLQQVKKESNDNVRVVVRCRPLNEKEKNMKCPMAVKCDEVRGSVTVNQSESRSGDQPKVFTFDRVFGPESKQTDVYNDTARSIVESVLEGYNGNLILFFNHLQTCIFLCMCMSARP